MYTCTHARCKPKSPRRSAARRVPRGSIRLVLELCEGGELYDRLIEHEYGYSEKEAAEILKQLFTALAYIHKQGIVHCDLKPDNFLFKDPSETSQIKIIDFGIFYNSHVSFLWLSLRDIMESSVKVISL